MVQWWCQLRESDAVEPSTLVRQASDWGIHAWLLRAEVQCDGALQLPESLESLLAEAVGGGPEVGLLLQLQLPLSPRAEAKLAGVLAGWLVQPGMLHLAGQPVVIMGTTSGFSHPSFGPRRLRLGLQQGLRLLGCSAEPYLVGPEPSNLWDSGLLWPSSAEAEYRLHLQRAHHGPWPPGPWIPVVLPPKTGDGDEAADLYREWLEQAAAVSRCQAATGHEGIVVLPDWQAHRQWFPEVVQQFSGTAGELRQQSPQAISASGVNDVVQAWGETQSRHLAVLVHGFYPDRLSELLRRLRGADPDGSGPGMDLYLSTPMVQLDTVAALLREQGWSTVRLHGVDNRGRDMAPFLLQLLPHALRNGHQLFLKLHTKRSDHLWDGEVWAEHLLGSLLEPAAYRRWMERLQAEDELGLLGPAGTLMMCSVALHANVDHLLALCARCGVSPTRILQRPFIAGSMMAGRLKALNSLPALELRLSDFEAEQGQTDGTLAHALERWLCCEAAERGWRLEELPGDIRAVPAFGHGRPLDASGRAPLSLPSWPA